MGLQGSNLNVTSVLTFDAQLMTEKGQRKRKYLTALLPVASSR